MSDVRSREILHKVRLAIACLCLIYAIFICGFAYGLSITENMLAVEAKIARPGISFSGPGEITDYSDLLFVFSTISAGFLVYILLTRSSRKLLTEVLSLMVILAAVYFLVFPAKPGYLPGGILGDSSQYLQLIAWCDLVFFCLALILIVLQIIAIWHASKSLSKKDMK